MRLFYVLFIFIFLMLSCSTQSTEKVKPLDRTNMDLTVKPGDNFYEYANGTWLKNNPIPPDYSRWGAFEILREQNWKDLETIFVEAATRKDAEPGSKWQKIGDFYATGMDTAKINEEGTKPLADLFKRIDDIKTTADVQEVIANFHSQGITPSFFLFSEQDQKNSNMVITWLYQGGLGLPDRDYYVKDDSRSKEIREAYLKHVTNMFKLMGDPEGTVEKNAQTVMNMETELAKASRTRLEMRNPKLNYNKMTLAELEHTAPYFDWASYFDRVGLGDPGDINVGQPDFFKETSKMMKTISINDWKTYLRWHLIDETAQYLSKDLLNEDFDFNGKFLSGTQELLPRWKRVLNTTSTNLGEL
ncbi:MAG: M13 family metallopeptidase N-terminal domain-containing protein, partial [Calditrichia bacterium]